MNLYSMNNHHRGKLNMNVNNKKLPTVSAPQRTELPEDGAPVLMPKQHTPMKKTSAGKKRTEELHYQLPPKEEEDDDDYQPPLPPKQRHQNNTSRALVYDFIGSELQELRATLAQFDANTSTA